MWSAGPQAVKHASEIAEVLGRGTIAALPRPESMTLLELVLYVLIAGICGAIARAIAGGTARGFVMSVLLGFWGAFVGMSVARALHLPTFAVAIGGHSFPVVWSIVGAVVLVAIAHALMRPRFRYLR
jgi:uncharacterized membrane protein YeaQ/YmgE (transglycosylase-associated protein family)